MKKAGITIEKISDKTVKAIAFFLIGIITVWAAMYTYCYPKSYIEYLEWNEDDPFRNIMTALVVFIITGVLSRLLFYGKSMLEKQRIVRWCAIVEMTFTGILLTVWVAKTNFPPNRDGKMVYETAIKIIHGNFSDVSTLYMRGYQHLYGLVFPEELLLRIWEDYHIFQYLNVILIVMILFFLYKITDMLFEDPGVDLFCLIGMAAFLPMHMYVSHVYGDIPSISLSILAIWALLKWCRTKRKRYLFIITAGLTMATMVRMNTLIIMIAMLICLAVHAWKEWDWRSVAAGVLIFLIVLGSIHLTPYLYEKRSGVDFGDTIPAILYIAMGMQAEEGSYGVYNGYHESVFWICDGSAEKASQIAAKYIQDRWGQFIDNPAIAYDFYKNKMLQQWGETTFGCLQNTYDEEVCQNTKWLQAVYLGEGQDKLTEYMNYCAFIIYAGTLLYIVQRLFKRDGIWNDLLLTVIVGGILFSLLWETRSRYVLPYVICMMPYMACGIWEIQEKIIDKWICIFQKKREG